MYPLSQSKHKLQIRSGFCPRYQPSFEKADVSVLVDIEFFKHFTHTVLLKLWHNFTTCPKGVSKVITEQIERVRFCISLKMRQAALSGSVKP